MAAHHSKGALEDLLRVIEESHAACNDPPEKNDGAICEL